MNFLQGNKNNANAIDSNNVSVYKPVAMTVPQKATVIGVSMMGLLGVSYLLDYFLCFIFFGICTGVVFYDNKTVIDFVNKNRILNDSIIQKLNYGLQNISFHLTPTQMTSTIALSAKNVSSIGSWINTLRSDGVSSGNKHID